MHATRSPLARPVPGTVRPIRESEFQLFRRLIHAEAGIHLVDGKQALVAGRLASRARALGLSTFGEYYDRVVADRDGEMVRMLDAICTNETAFFREPEQFEWLAREVAAGLEADAASGVRRRQVRAWSAACSTGEEAYTLAMVLLGRFPPAAGWTIQVVASDLSTTALERARAGIWPVHKAQPIPDRFLKRFMLKGSGPRQGLMKAGPELRSVVTFQRLNLAGPSYRGLGEFDVIFCRNVLIYFDAEGRAKVVDRLLQHLKPSAHLFLGHSEGLTGAGHPLRPVTPNVYARVDRTPLRPRNPRSAT